MASNRHLGRVIVLQSLYEFELRTLAGDKNVDLDMVVAKNIEPYEKALGDTEFVYNLARRVAENFETLDTALQPMAPEWPIASIAAVDRNVLRMGLYELSECGDTIPPKVAINEAVELAKAFGSENSSKFVNGVLGTAYKQLGISEEKNGAKDKTKQAGAASKVKPDGATKPNKAKPEVSDQAEEPKAGVDKADGEAEATEPASDGAESEKNA